MNSLQKVPQKTTVEVIPPADQLRTVIKSNPFISGSKVFNLPAGKTLLDIVDEFVDSKWPTGYINVYLDGQHVPSNLWQRIRPKAGHEVVVCLTPSGGRGGSGQLIIGIALIGLAVGLGPLGLGVAMGMSAGMASQMALSIGMMGASALLSGIMQMAFTPSLPKMGSLSGSGMKSPSLGIEGSRNSSRPFEVVPRLLGKHRIVPDYAALPYTEDPNSKQYLRMLFTAGYGPMEISDIRIGDTPLSEFGIKDEDIEIRYGFPHDKPITIFPDTVITTGLALRLTTDFQTRTTYPEADEIDLQFTTPRGAYTLDAENGDVTELVDITLKIEYRKFGTSGEWLNYSNITNSRDGRYGYYAIKNPKKEASTYGLNIKLPSRGQYDVRIKRKSAESDDDKEADQINWTALRTIRDKDPVILSRMFPGNTANHKGGLTRIAIKVKATDKLNGVIDTFNFVGRSILMDYGKWSLDFSDATTPLNAGKEAQRTGSLPRTIECLATAKGVGGLFQAGSSSTSLQDFSLRLSNSGTSTWTVELGGGVTHDVVLPGSVNAEHHYALVYTGTKVILYYDGVNKGEWTHTLSTPSRDLLIGKCSTSMFNGYIHEFRSWKVARSSTEINAWKNQIILNQNNNLVGYWRMSEGSGSTVYNYGTSNTHITFASTGPEWLKGLDADRIWEPRPTNNPGACLREIFQGAANKRTVADSRLLLSDIEDFGTYCRDKAWSFNMVVDFKSNVFEMANMVANSGRASVTMLDGKYSLVHDIPKSVYKQVFTPANSWDFRGIKIFKETIHGVRCRFASEKLNWQQTERIVYADGFTESNATKFEAQDFKGITNWAQVKSHARYALACAKLRPEAFEINADIENLTCTRGDLVRLNHDVISVGLGFGRIRSVTKNGENKVDYVVTNDLCPMEAGQAYVIGVRLSDGSIVTHEVNTVAGEQTTLTLKTPTSQNISADNLYYFGIKDREAIDCIVTNIVPQSDLAARLTLAPASPDVHNADKGAIPDYDPLISTQKDVSKKVKVPEIKAVTSDISTAERLPDGSWRPRIHISYSIPQNKDLPGKTIQTQYRLSKGSGEYIDLPYQDATNSGSVFISGVEIKKNYDVRIRLLTESGLTSGWVERKGIFIQDINSIPADIKGFWVKETNDGKRIFEWRFGSASKPQPNDVIVWPTDLKGFIIKAREGTGWTWDQMNQIHQGLITNMPYETYALTKSGPTYTIGIKAKNNAGNLSQNAKIITFAFGRVFSGKFAYESAREQRWPGTITNGFENNIRDYSGVGELQGSDSKTWADLATDGVTWETWDSWTRSANELFYEHPVIDLGAVKDAVIDVSGTLGEGNLGDAWERHSNDNVTWTSYASFVVGNTITARYFQIKGSVQKGTGTVPILRDMIISL
jgi:predicted phage tail protein